VLLDVIFEPLPALGRNRQAKFKRNRDFKTVIEQQWLP
jgi:hypothetical protein